MAIPNRLVVLLADDDENDILLIRRAFRSVGNFGALHAVPDGEEAVAYLLGNGTYADRGHHPFPDVLVLDHRMPRLSGLGVLCWLRGEARFASIPVLVFSLTLLPAETEAISRLRGASCIKPLDGSGTSVAIRQGIRNAFALVGQTSSAAGKGPQTLLADAPSTGLGTVRWTRQIQNPGCRPKPEGLTKAWIPDRPRMRPT